MHGTTKKKMVSLLLPIQSATTDSHLEARISKRHVHVAVQTSFSSVVRVVPSATRN